MEEIPEEGTITPATAVDENVSTQENVEGEKGAAKEKETTKEVMEEEPTEGEHMEGDHIETVEGELVETDHVEGEHTEGEHVKEEHANEEQSGAVMEEGDELMKEETEGEHVERGELEEDHILVEQKPLQEEFTLEEQGYIEEPPPDPAAPFDFSDSKEALKPPFQLRPDQLAEVEQLWELFQNYTPVYTDLENYITEKELVYMLKSLNLMTVTPEQLQELIAFFVRPPHPLGHIAFDQFVRMVTVRQRDFSMEDELRAALRVLDPDHTGNMDREELKDLLASKGHKMPQKQLDNLIKEVDLTNDGTIGVEDVIGTMCIDLNPEDIQMLRAAIYPDELVAEPKDEF